MKKIGKVFFCIYGFGANLLTYINGIKETIDLLNEYYIPEFLANVIVIVLNPLILVILSVLTLTLLLLYGTKPYRKHIGTHGIECNLIPTLKYKWGIKNCKLLHIIHKKLYHQAYEIKAGIRKEKNLNYENQQKIIAGYLQIANHALRQVIKQDLTINIKRLSFDKKNNWILTPYAHYRNEYATDPMNNRNFDHIYTILTGNNRDKQQNVHEAQNYITQYGNKSNQINSAFCSLFSDENSTYWMTNDLCKESEQQQFYTSSNNYPKCYKSMAVFKIVPPEGAVIPEGIVVFDSEKENIFSEKTCAQIMGFIAHMLYEIFFEMNEYEKRKLQEQKTKNVPQNRFKKQNICSK